jgi:hypothetical protein
LIAGDERDTTALAIALSPKVALPPRRPHRRKTTSALSTASLHFFESLTQLVLQTKVFRSLNRRQELGQLPLLVSLNVESAT